VQETIVMLKCDGLVELA